MDPRIFPARDIVAALVANGVPPEKIVAPDADYCVAASGFLGPFKDVWKAELENLPEPRRHVMDCDKFTRECSTLARRLHAKTPDAPEAGLAFGDFYYVDPLIGGHAICVTFRLEDGKLRPVFLEPQKPWPLIEKGLSRETIATCIKCEL